MENAKNILQKLERLWRNFILVSSKQSDIASIKRCITEGKVKYKKKKLDAGGGVIGVVFEGRSTRGGDDNESTRK
ncbi:hypothetical protein YC2023_107414 [Brassica napus]